MLERFRRELSGKASFVFDSLFVNGVVELWKSVRGAHSDEYGMSQVARKDRELHNAQAQGLAVAARHRVIQVAIKSYFGV